MSSSASIASNSMRQPFDHLLPEGTVHQRQLDENSQVVELLAKIVEELQALSTHETSESHLATLCSTKPDRKQFKAALKELEDRGTIVCLRDFKPPHSKVCRGWKLKELTSDKTTSDMSELTVWGVRGDHGQLLPPTTPLGVSVEVVVVAGDSSSDN